MRKILLLSEIFPPQHGGSGRWFWEIYSRLPANRVEFGAGHYPGASEFDRSQTHRIHRLPLSSPSWGLRSLVGLRFYLNNLWRLIRLTRRIGVEEIHCGRCLPEGVIAWLLKNITGRPYSCYVHGEDVETAATSRELSWMVQRVLNNSERLICNSHNSAALLRENWGVDADRIAVMHPGVDVDRFSSTQIRPQPPGWAGKNVILTVGRLQKRKGHDMLISALPELSHSHPDVHYCIVGDGKEKAELARLAQDLGVAERVEFRDAIDDETMIACYQHCALFALPNRTVGRDIEGFGIVLLEAQACGKAVLAGDSGGTRETMVPDETGVIVDCTAPEPLAAALSRLLADPERLARMGEAGVSQALRFHWPNLARDAERLFSKSAEVKQSSD
ncbi:glycosyltransferase family 4 protein [Marinobacter changyiensis]|uniref:glycosyltransferase family 4 protein n=1 Tax=Marinobacter changyiensis TaxID=2604091 RepID=UPI0012648F31|nr:glycosyltransferase family 4 protein [Marinobacter changyiensis]